MIDWIVGFVIGAAVIAVVRKRVQDRKAGKPGCGCSGCSSKKNCRR